MSNIFAEVNENFNKKIVINDGDTYKEAEMKRYLGFLNEQNQGILSTINENFIMVNRKLDEHTEILTSHTEMIGTLMEDMTIVKNDLKQKVDYPEFSKLDIRVKTLERA